MSRLLKNIRIHYELYLFVLPAAVAIFLFRYIPIYGVQIAFRDFVPSDGFLGSAWVGLEHFRRFFNSYRFWPVMRNTIGISLYGLVGGFPVPIILALALNQVRHARFKRIVQTVTYMPHFISTVVVVGMILLYLSPSRGLYGAIAEAMGREPINVMGRPEYFKSIFVLSNIWQRTGWSSIIYLAVLSNVDPQLYEAATLDGAKQRQKVWYIDVPYIIPTAVILLILTSGQLLNVGFEKIYLMQNPLNISSSEVIATYVYKAGLLSAQYSFASAVGLFNAVINFSLLLTVNWLAGKLGETKLW